MPVDPQAVVLAAIAALAGFAAFSDKLGNLLKTWKQVRAQPNNMASNYFRDLGDAFAKVHAELKERRSNESLDQSGDSLFRNLID